MKNWMVMAVVLINSGCISAAINKAIPQKGLQVEELKRVKKVAIVAFDVLEYKPTGVAEKLSGHVTTVQTAKNVNGSPSELAKELYGDLQQTLKSKGWEVLPLEKVVSNPHYISLHAKKKPGLLEKSPNHFHKPGIITQLIRPINPPYLFTAVERTDLAKALGVDSLVIARVSFYTEKNDYLGLGIASTYLKPVLAFDMYNSTSDKEIWFDRGFSGPRSEESLGKVSGLEDEEKIARFSRPLTQATLKEFILMKQ
jgi:hypothetical protein